MKRWLFIIFLLLPVFGISQSKGTGNPGYMGKHFILTGEGSFSGSAFIMKEYYLKYGGAGEVVLGKYFGLGVSYLHSSVVTSEFPHSDDCYEYSEFTFNTNTYGLDFYVYLSRSIAPIGDYFRFQIAYFSNYSDDYNKNGIINSQKDPYSCQDYSTDLITSYNYGFSFFYGRKRIYYDFLVVSYGFQMGMTFYNPLTIRITNELTNEKSNFLEASAYENSFSTFLALKVNVGIIW